MLVLARTVGQSFHIGDDVIVEIKQVNGTATKLGVNAPKDVSVHREEIFQGIGCQLSFTQIRKT